MYQISGTQISLLHALVFIQSKAWPLIVVLLYKYVDSGLFGTVEPLVISSLRPCQSGGGGVPCRRLNFKTFPVGVYKCVSLIVGFVVTVTIWPREVVSCRDFILLAVATFWAMSLVGIYPGRASSLATFLAQQNGHTFSYQKTPDR